MLQQLEDADPLEVLTQHPRTAQLPLNRAQIIDVLGKCLQSECLKTCLSGQSGRPSQFDLLIHLLDQHHSTIDQLAAAGPAPELVSSKALLNHCTRMHAECNTGVLPMLQGILKKNGNKLQIQLEGIELLVSPANGLVSKSKLAERGYNAQRQYSIVHQGKNKNAAVKLEWFGIGNYSGERFRDEPDLVMGSQTLEWNKSPGQHMPLLSFTRTMAKSIWPNHVAPISKISSHGTSRLHELLGYSPESNTPLIIENGQTYLSSSDDAPVHMFIFINKQLAGIRLGFKDSHADNKTSVSMKLETNFDGNPWTKRPLLKQATWVKETIVPTFGAVELQSKIEWEPCGTVNTERFTVLQQENLRWQGKLTAQQCLQNARLTDEEGQHCFLQFPVDGDSDPIPLDALPLFSEIRHSSLEGNYPFKAHYLDCTQKTPSPGFEGFVFKLPVGPYLFSGYLTATDRAMGILYPDDNNPGTYLGKQFVGNFLWLRGGIDSEIMQTMSYSKEDTLTPIAHGRCAVVYVSPRDNMSEMKREHLFNFWRLSFSNNLKIANLKPFSAPGCLFEFKLMTEYSNASPEEICFKLSQEADDHYLIRPRDHVNLQNYNIQYQNVGLFGCKLLLINRTVKQGTLEFPNGLKYTGQLELINNTLHLKGQGKMTWEDVSLKAIFNGDRVRNLLGLTPETKVWLDTLQGKTTEDDILLDDLLHDLSGHTAMFSTHMAPALLLKSDLFRAQ
ncbi:hypothetical protein [Limnobacter parvus]|uniref:Uncharacterized protein n=1 Tax=Limnobacter parvus TaxID=2939690 RepID=A0ABT1XG36_9BURK|nr:hypothetical protein [Limnobacter parvus]MCR2746240.1 hypothetical protein [Limnobacter parvus]